MERTPTTVTLTRAEDVSRFVRRGLSEDEVRAVFGEEIYDLVATGPVLRGTCTVASVNRAAGVIIVEPSPWRSGRS